jgi:hypothetical protein
MSIGPPRAWIEAQAKSAWLFYETYCWKTTCIDTIGDAKHVSAVGGE